DLEREAGRDDDLARRRDVRELRLHLRALVLELERVDAVPGLLVFLGDHVDQAPDDALLGRREVAALDARVVLAGAAEERVDHREHQRRVADDQAGAAQRPHADDVEVRRHDDLAQERAVLLHLDAADRDLRALADEVEQPAADVAGEALVDDLHRGHAPANDPLLAGEVVVAHPAGGNLFLFQLLAFAGDALQQGIDFVLREDLLVHGRSPVVMVAGRSRRAAPRRSPGPRGGHEPKAKGVVIYWMMKLEKCTWRIGLWSPAFLRLFGFGAAASSSSSSSSPLAAARASSTIGSSSSNSRPSGRTASRMISVASASLPARSSRWR